MTTPDGHLRSTSYSRRIGDYVRPPSSLRLDGTLSYYAKTGHENEDVLHALPTGVALPAVRGEREVRIRRRRAEAVLGLDRLR